MLVERPQHRAVPVDSDAGHTRVLDPQPPRHPVLDAGAQAMAALIRLTWVTTTTVRPTRRSAAAVRSSHARTRTPSADSASPHPAHSRDFAPPRPTSVGTDAGRSPRVSRSPARSSGRRPRLPRPNAAAVSRARRSGLDTTRSGTGSVAANPAAWVRPRSVNGGSDRPSSRPAAFGAVSP